MDENNQYDQNIRPTNKKLIVINIFLIITIFIGLFLYMIFVDGIDNILNILTRVDYRFVLGGIICLIMLWFCNALTLHLPLKRIYKNQTFKNSIKVSMIGQLFNNITPFSSGGQPMQAYELTKTGKRPSDSMSVLATQFIITQISLIVFTLIIIIFEFDFFKTLFQNYLWLAILGFGANIALIVGIILIGINKRMITWITTPCIKLLSKIKIIKSPDNTIAKLDDSIQHFNDQFKWIVSQKKTSIQIFIISGIQSMFYYGITYMVYRAFGNSGISFLQIVPAQAFLLLIMTIMPTPGAGIGAEGGFLLLFQSIFQNGTINMSILFWRIYTFYLPIIVGAFFLIPNKNSKL